MSRPGSNHRDDGTYQVANLASLFTVCALALNDVDEWSDEIRKSVTQDVKLVLEMGALLAEDAGLLLERQIAEAKKPEARS
ncbi:hypothetical protein [Pararhizobium gei]|uniref:hypothetical protein n=1 Tax=Pararhizobium gei TaxID=1395951 RepID=UPI0023DAEC03|nr:hypothetical protein [Rhizobium gei]